MNSILDDRKKLNELKRIIFENAADPDMVEARTHELYELEPEQDVWEALTSYVTPAYMDEYDMIGAAEELGRNDYAGNVILKPECRTEQGTLSDYFANVIDAHHVEYETYWLYTLSGMTVYIGDDQDKLVNAFISYMDEAHDTEAGCVDYDEMLELLDDFGTPLCLEVTQELAARPSIRRYHGHRI